MIVKHQAGFKELTVQRTIIFKNYCEDLLTYILIKYFYILHSNYAIFYYS